MQIQLSIFNKHFSIKVVYILLFLLIAGAFLRFYNLEYTGLWLDEIYSMKGASPNSTLEDIYEYSKGDQPPIFFFLLFGWLKLFGSSDFSGHALTCTFGILGILAMYFLGKEFKDERLGLLAAFITTINWFHIGISIEIRFYALVFLLSTLSYLFLLRSIKRTRLIDFVGYAIATAILLNTHYFGMVVFTSQFLIFLIVIFSFKKSSKLLVGGLIAGFIAALSLSHWQSVIDHDLQIINFHLDPITLRVLFRFFWSFVYDPLAFLLYIVFAGLIVKNYYEKIITKSFQVEDLVLVGWLFIGFAIPFLYTIFRVPLFTNKYCSIQLPAIFLLVAMGLNSIRKGSLRVYSIAALTISALFVLFVARPQYKKSRHEDGRELWVMYFTVKEADEYTWDEDWREVANFFAERNTENHVVFSQMAWFHEYYFNQLNLKQPFDQNIANVDELIRDKDQIWLLVHAFYKNGRQPIRFLPAQKKLIRQDFELKEIVYFKRSKAFLYTRKKPATQ